MAHLSYKEYAFYSVKGRKLPKFYMKGTALEYVREYKYLGYWITSCLTDKYQMNVNFRKIKNSIFQFKRFFKRAPINLLVKVAQSFFSSKFYGLEFAKEITNNQITRFNYFYNIWFGSKTEATNRKLCDYPKLQLQTLFKNAKERYENIQSRL